ncbi:toxin-antitoxin system [Mycobacterium kubicae]|uniref:toxin-antitoxin system n=1 Tax=Mycobacterium kubicae TaxID=120959 RepID=UPI00164048EA|nr:toxin-antitoxin system [Mycobacterium kubicae]QNI15346.1 toxin-antitoxin system [Mycobacterium kubicae]
MPRPTKGDRKVVMVRPPRIVAERLEQRWRAAGASSLSQYLADLLAVHVGLPELAAELNRVEEVLPLAM